VREGERTAEEKRKVERGLCESWKGGRTGWRGGLPEGPGRVARMRHGGGGSGLAFRERETQ